jgi:hypothetical protein
MKPFHFLFLFLCIAFNFIITDVHSQGNTGFTIGGGMMFYNGDLSDKTNKVFTNPKLFQPYGSIGISQWLTGHIEGLLKYTHGKVAGADSLSLEKNNKSRNLSFESSIDDVSLTFEINSLHRYERSRMNVYVFSGVSVFHFNPQAELNGTWNPLQPLGTEGQYIPQGGYAKPYNLFQLSVPVGFGITVQLNKKIRLKAEFMHNFLFTDYLDDVSTVYPDVEALSATPNGETAVDLSSRRLDGNFPKAHTVRGGSKYNDAFSSFGLTLAFNPGISHCPATFKTTKIKRH